MAYRRKAFAPGEWYHCFTRTVDRKDAFRGRPDFNRFLELLYLSNDTHLQQRGAFQGLSHIDILERKRHTPIVSVAAYCLMPNHFHLMLQEISEGGITSFMRKVGTGYAMYFNLKNKRIGNVFVKPFRSKHVGDDAYFRRAVSYIHLNPAELFEPEWKQGIVRDKKKLEETLLKYSYSSLPDVFGKTIRPERAILDPAAVELIAEDHRSFSEQIEETAEYYADLAETDRSLLG